MNVIDLTGDSPVDSPNRENQVQPYGGRRRAEGSNASCSDFAAQSALACCDNRTIKRDETLQTPTMRTFSKTRSCESRQLIRNESVSIDEKSLSPQGNSLIFAHLDASKSCNSCGASHAFYLMYEDFSLSSNFMNHNKLTGMTPQYSCALCKVAPLEVIKEDSNPRFASGAVAIDPSSASPVPSTVRSGGRKTANRASSTTPTLESPVKQMASVQLFKSACQLRRHSRTSTAAPPSTTIPILWTNKNLSSSMSNSHQVQSCNIQVCFDLLHGMEDELEVAFLSLSEDFLSEMETKVRRELYFEVAGDQDIPFPPPSWLPNSPQLSEKEKQTEESFDKVRQMVENELEEYQRLWQDHIDLIEDSIRVLHFAIQSAVAPSSKNCNGRESSVTTSKILREERTDTLLAYYQWRASKHSSNTEPSWKVRADAFLDQRKRNYKMNSVRVADKRSKENEVPDHGNNNEVEQISSAAEAKSFNKFMERRGEGWSHSAVQQSNAILMDDRSLDDHPEDDAIAPDVVWTEDGDRRLQEIAQKESSICYHVEFSCDKKLHHDTFIPPPQKISRCEEKSSSHRQPLQSPRRGPVEEPPPEALEVERKPSSPRCLKDDTHTKNLGDTSTPPRKRAKRKCQRCVQFGGRKATLCQKAKGRFGRKACQFFGPNGASLRTHVDIH